MSRKSADDIHFEPFKEINLGGLCHTHLRNHAEYCLLQSFFGLGHAEWQGIALKTGDFRDAELAVGRIGIETGLDGQAGAGRTDGVCHLVIGRDSAGQAEPCG